MKANEISPTRVIRTSHSGVQLVIRSLTSNKVDRAATYNYYQKIKQKRYNEDRQLKKYGSNR
ncbi:hypothetical protein GCM10007049_38870 [Echinicola pacifica]|uniref:Uncharacterized protein n=1 Tax=Echinicola pacifica TaxID=346377 RepID=A0A918UYA4_9BACT|nr:hypothetical protein GCM10007049_38870 [Echinicola pacifica]